MGAFFVYILKASICLAVFYLFYRLLLSRETFHRFNRMAILGILAVSLLIPFCEVTIEKETEIHQTVLGIEQILLLADASTEAVSPTKEVTITWIQILLVIYFLGVLFFMGRNLYSFMRLCLLLRSGRKEKLNNGISLVVHNKEELSPFSWMKYVVISQKDLEENGREILIHETAHIHNRHSIDLLVADVCIFFQWFNPAAWLLKQELQNIHEFEADETVIKKGVNAKEYQLLLIKKAVGTRLYSMANSFNHSKLKKRITMMLKEKSSPWARLKYLYILPLAAVAVSVFARPEISNELNEISAVKVNDLVTIVETPPPLSVKRNRKSGNSNPDNSPLIIVDGEVISSRILASIDPNKIDSLSVLKDKSLTEKYGEKANNGVLLITLKEDDSQSVLPVVEKPAASSETENSRWITTKEKANTDNKLKVKGVVKDEWGEVVVGASVLEENTYNGTITDMDGNFTLSVHPNAEIVVLYIGMQKTKVKAAKEVEVVLKEE